MLSLTSCTKDEHSSAPTHDGSQPARAEPHAAALEVCGRFATLALASDAAVDHGPSDARRRAADQLGTADLAGSLGGEGRDHDWPELARRQARVQVSTDPIGDDPPPVSTRAAAGVLAHRVAVSQDGWRRQLPDIAVYCSLVRVDGGWRVGRVNFADSSSSGTTR
ncbi:hypothetical protein [Saccharothrix sp.]|uniref:hypothetical protein n=1 Tax=Saccharothrix sp. TaxID=1873460 RepID=UPI002811E692|nr:hypothetical protein [Saccharothrix sp.]